MPPHDVAELLARARALAGYSLSQLASERRVAVPTSTRHAKGWAGELLEQALGADAGSRPVPDFTALGIELKTIPIDAAGRPLESTYVCVAPARIAVGLAWENSLVRRKLAHVLWIPIEGTRGTSLPARRIGWAILWRPTAVQERILREDWEELTECLALGQRDALSARLGQVLQLRPKAAHGRTTMRASDEDGLPHLALPRGFYLRATFTAQILRAANQIQPEECA